MDVRYAKPLDDLIPIESIGGVALINILVALIVIVICFIAGILATGKYIKKMQSLIVNGILVKIPGYLIIKAFMDRIITTEEASANFNPILVAFDDYEQLCFEIEKAANEKTIVYLPGAPNPWSGSVLYVDNSRVKHLNISVNEALKNIQSLGLGSKNISSKK